MYRKIFIYSALILGPIGFCVAEEPGAIASAEAQIQSNTNTGSDIIASTESAIFPKLLWEKNLTRKLTSFAMSSDGTKIAIADETGYLTLYNIKGEKLWDYHYEGNLPKQIFDFVPDKNKANTVLTDVVFSSSGKYMVFEVSVLNTYKGCEGPEEGCQVYRPYKKIFFDSEGKLLWQTSKKGMHVVGGDEYVLINPDDPEENFTYYLLNNKGQVLFANKLTGMCEGGGLSEDGEYLYMCDKLIDPKSGRTVWKLIDKKLEFEGVVGKLAILAVLGENRSVIYDISTHQLLEKRDRKQPTKRDISDKSIYMRRMKGLKLLELTVKTLHGDEYELTAGYQSQKHSYFSISKAGELVLFGQYKTVKLYKSY